MIDESLGAKSSPILTRINERLHHLCLNKIAVELVQFVQPIFITGIIHIRSRIWITTQITKVLHQHKRSIKLLLYERRVFGHMKEHLAYLVVPDINMGC